MVKEISKYAYEESVITYIIYAFSAKASLMTRIEYEAESAARQTCVMKYVELPLSSHYVITYIKNDWNHGQVSVLMHSFVIYVITL